MTTTSLLPPSSDVSVQLLNMVLGSGWTAWSGGSASATATATASNVVTLINVSGSLIGELMSSLSSVLLLIAAMVLVYTYGTGAANAAHTGDPKVNSMWTPLRQAFGVAALAPLPGLAGISVIVAMISFPIQLGIGAADNLASLGAQALVKTGGQVAPANPPIVSPTAIKALFTDLVVQTYMNNIGWSIIPAITWTQDNSQLTITYTATNAGATLPASAFGTITLDCPATQVPGLCGPGGAALVGIGKLVQTLEPTAVQIVNSTNGYATTNAPTITAASTSGGASTGAIQTAIQAYQTAIQTALASYNAQNHTQLSQQLKSVANSIDAEGWASLPMFYYQISKFNNQAQGVASGLNLSVTLFNGQTLAGSTYSELDAAVQMAQDYVDAAPLGDQINILQSNAAATGTTGGSGSTTPGSGWFSTLNIFKIVAKNVMNLLSNGTDPIADLQQASNWGIDTISTAYASSIALKAAGFGACEGGKIAAKAADGFAGGLGAAVAGVAGTGGVSVLCAASSALDSALKVFGFLALPMIAALLVGAFYLPMTPSIVMTLGILSWISMAVELLIASILWAFAHILPGGDDVINDHAKEGYFMLLDVCLRPALMVFGYFLSVAMIAVAAYFVTTGLSIAFDGMNGMGFGPVSSVAEVVIVIGTLYVAINNSVGLIHRLPKTAMQMVGRGMGMDMGEEQSESKVNALVMNRAGSVQHQASGSSHGGNRPGNGGKPIADAVSKAATKPEPASPAQIEQVGQVGSGE